MWSGGKRRKKKCHSRIGSVIWICVSRFVRVRSLARSPPFFPLQKCSRPQFLRLKRCAVVEPSAPRWYNHACTTLVITFVRLLCDFFFFFSLFSTFVILYRTKVSRLFIYYLRPSRRAISLAQLFLLLSTMSGGWTLAWVGFGRLCFRQIRANLVMFVYTIGGLG